MLNPRSTNSLLVFMVGLVLGCFVLTCIRPGWDSVAQFLIVLAFAGFALWVDPFRKQEVTRDEYDRLREMTLKLQEELRSVRFKLFGQK